MMVVVVPALAHREQREGEVVARVVVGGVAPTAPHVGERVDRVGGVPAYDLADEEAPHQAGRAAERPERQSEPEHRQRPPAVEPLELGVLRKVLDPLELGVLEVAAQDPALVRPPEPGLLDRVQVAGGVGQLVVHAMMPGPPQRSLLAGHRRAEAEHELKPARRLEAAVGEIAMIRPGHEEHPGQVERSDEARAAPRPAGEDHADDRGDVDRPVRHGPTVEVGAAPARRLRGFDSGHGHQVPAPYGSPPPPPVMLWSANGRYIGCAMTQTIASAMAAATAITTTHTANSAVCRTVGTRSAVGAAASIAPRSE